MKTLSSTETDRLMLTSALEELMADMEQIRTQLSKTEWKQLISQKGDKKDVLISRLVFDLLQANDHILKSKNRLVELMQLQSL